MANAIDFDFDMATRVFCIIISIIIIAHPHLSFVCSIGQV